MRLKDLAEIKTDFPDADFWLKRVNSQDIVGEPVKEYKNTRIGIKVIRNDILNSQYLYYAMMHLWQKGYWKSKSYGMQNRVNIRIEDVKNIQIGNSVNENMIADLQQGFDMSREIVIDGHMLSPSDAHVILAVYNKLNSNNIKRFENLGIVKMKEMAHAMYEWMDGNII